MRRSIIFRPILRRPILALSCLAVAGPALAPALAQEPLFLRIRPTGASPANIGAGGPGALRARAIREDVWARNDRRARIAIASVCTGCLAPEPTETGSIPEAPPRAAPPSLFAQNR